MRAGATFPSGSIPSSISSHFKKSDLMMISLAACMPSGVLAVFFLPETDKCGLPRQLLASSAKTCRIVCPRVVSPVEPVNYGTCKNGETGELI
jgi:hypothetical protein